MCLVVLAHATLEVAQKQKGIWHKANRAHSLFGKRSCVLLFADACNQRKPGCLSRGRVNVAPHKHMFSGSEQMDSCGFTQ